MNRSFSALWRAVQATPFAVHAAMGALAVGSLSSATASTAAQVPVETPQQRTVQRNHAGEPSLDVKPNGVCFRAH